LVDDPDPQEPWGMLIQQGMIGLAIDPQRF
jgi:hypothetical protein